MSELRESNALELIKQGQIMVSQEELTDTGKPVVYAEANETGDIIYYYDSNKKERLISELQLRKNEFIEY